MKKLTIILGIILVVLLVFVGTFYFGGRLRATATALTANASEYPDAFETIKSIAESGAAPQTFDLTPLGDASQYTIVDMTILLENRGYFSADWMHISYIGQPGDIVVYSLTGEGTDLPARSNGQINLKLLTTNAADRYVTIEYYVYGMKRTIDVVCGNQPGT